jgi:hypothetical protein
MMVPLYWSDLNGTGKLLVSVGIGAVIAVGLLLFPEPIRWSHFVVELLWPSAAFYSMLTMRSQLEGEAKQRSTKLELDDRATIANAFAEGRSYVLGLVSKTRYEARRDLAAVRDRLDKRINDEVTRRLDEVDKRLEELSCANES